MKRDDIRNVAIIAHVDHGKTTLVDMMMRQSGLFRAEELDRLAGGQHGLILDSNDLERERGITILAKNIALTVAGHKVNIIDTPGHADFGGEVERTLKLADGALLLVDAAEGVLPQTRFVLRKAFECGLKPIVVINKIDRPDARPIDVLNSVFDLFVELDADEETLEFATVYASGRHGHASLDLNTPGTTLQPLFDTILTRVPPPEVQPDAPLQMLIVTLDYSDYVGRIAVGKVVSGKIRKNQRIALLKQSGERVEGNVKQLFTFDRMGRTETDEVSAGDICAVVGIDDFDIGNTIADPENAVRCRHQVDEPTSTWSSASTIRRSAAGRHLRHSRQLRDRLMKSWNRTSPSAWSPATKHDEFHVRPRSAPPFHPDRKHAREGFGSQQAEGDQQDGRRPDVEPIDT